MLSSAAIGELCGYYFYEARHEKVLQVTLTNTARKPYYIPEPFVVQYDRFRYMWFISVDYIHNGCKNCWVSEGDVIRRIVPDFMFLRKRKPYVATFSPCFDELICPCGHKESKSGTYQIRAFYKIGNDTIYSNPVSLYYVDDTE